MAAAIVTSMMTKERITKIKARIRRAQSSFNIGGDMLLGFEIDAMTLLEKLELQTGLLAGKVRVQYKYLNESIAKSQKEAQ